MLLTIRRGVNFWRAQVAVLDQSGRQIGSFKSKVFSLGGGFDVFDAQGTRVAEIKGDWKGWNFTLRGPNGEELGKVTKKWAGIGKELFTTADNYVIALNETAARTRESVAMLLAAGLAVDTVYKEKQAQRIVATSEVASAWNRSPRSTPSGSERSSRRWRGSRSCSSLGSPGSPPAR